MIGIYVYCGFLIIAGCCIGWSMYHAPSDVELWGSEIE